MTRLFMETTGIDADKTAAEITALLVSAGAKQIAMDYSQGKLSGLKFALAVNGALIAFQLPARIEPIFMALNHRRSKWDRTAKAPKDQEQAERVAWRQLYRWIQAQVALIQTGMVQSSEVFLPYAIGQDGRTVFEAFQEHGLKLLAAPEGAR